MLLQENVVVADRFRLVRMIGRGGMGSVWEALHLGLDTTCAVKFIEGELANVAEAHARFEREAKAAAQLRSPNVVQIIDHGVWQGHPYIAMELLEGEDLGKRLAKSGGKLGPAEVNFVVQQVCRALSRAHAAGVVHRDLKPDNVFVVKDDDRDIVKILDFGVAKSAASALDGSNTKTGAMLGTPYYMSPEQAQGIKSVDSRSDLWSLAVIVFQCLTGRLPFESEALGDLLVKIIVAPIPTASAYNPLVPPGFDAWWVKAADRNPDNRFQTAKLFAESLGLALGQSSESDVSDRSRLQRGGVGGSTALMVGGPGEVYANAPNTPMPGAHTAAMVTPNPMMHTPPGFQQQPSGMQGPPGAQQPGQPAPYGHTTGNPVAATFSGVEPGGAAKKSPIGLFIGIAALAVVGLGLGGVALVKGRTAHGGDGTGSALASGSAGGTGAAASSAAATPTQVAAADPAPPVSAEPPASATPSASVAAATPATPATPVAAAGPAGGTHHAAPSGARGSTGTTTKPATTGGAAAAAATPPPKGKEKPINLGF